jgi:ABC-2 type transport system permease protein
MLSSAGLLAIGANVMKTDLPINFADISFAPLPLNLFFTLTGFLLFAAIMVGVGSIGTSYRDSQSLSGIFIMLSVMPFYFITILIADPNGPLAIFTSYFPLTAPMILLIRNSLQALSPAESVLGVVVMLAYVAIAFWAATKMFDLGSLMYNRRPSAKEVLTVLRK